MKKINPPEAKGKKKRKLKVWFFYWPNQLDQIGRKGACGFVYLERPTMVTVGADAILMTATAVEASPKSPTPKPSRRAG